MLDAAVFCAWRGLCAVTDVQLLNDPDDGRRYLNVELEDRRELWRFGPNYGRDEL